MDAAPLEFVLAMDEVIKIAAKHEVPPGDLVFVAAQCAAIYTVEREDEDIQPMTISLLEEARETAGRMPAGVTRAKSTTPRN